MDVSPRQYILQGANSMMLLNPQHGLVTRGMTGWWPFIEGSGSTAKDMSGNANYATLYNATWGAGPIGLYRTGYSGSSGSYGMMGSAVSGYHDTICFWFTPTTEVSAGTTYKAIMAVPSANFPGLFTGEGSSSMTSETFSILQYSTVGYGTYIKDRISKAWHHMAISWNGSAYDIYMDGTARTTYASSYGHASRMSGYRWQWAARTNAANYSAILFADLRIHNVGLTADEIAAIAAGRG